MHEASVLGHRPLACTCPCAAVGGAVGCRLRSDLLLGVASLPLSALLQECWVDGYAPVYAIMTKASAATAGSGSSSRPQHDVSQQAEERVQVSLCCTHQQHTAGKSGCTAQLYLAHHL